MTKLGEDLGSPYRYTWTNTPAGIHTLKALAFDTTGASMTSAPVNITVYRGASAVTNALISFSSVWKFLDNGSDPSPSFPFPFGADTMLLGGTGNCAKGNTIGFIGFDALPPEC